MNITLKDIAEKIGVKEATVQRYESGNGIKSVSIESIANIANVLSCTPAYLVGWENSKSITDIFNNELLCYMNILSSLPEDKRKMAYGYIDCFKEQ